eukprot:gnl/TRDRNA2_/TRDRNA2_165553_c0_seq1.p1 gnl/TRDRNA2_/TRDRNA2_165553_c0~~gnl/TRDRNA2_/TRDRNA2_165553_c0_seq1.p1  ORF type:complete len:140 (+),score=16.60 gnl/TRDRNA2_/TRDRNA2_165553_c0_seq1:142-561(+)
MSSFGPTSFAADAQPQLGTGQVTQVGGVPFMCYKVEQISRVAQPAQLPGHSSPLLLTMPPGAGPAEPVVPSADQLEASWASPLTAGAPGGLRAPPYYYGVWPAQAPSPLALVLLRPPLQRNGASLPCARRILRRESSFL